MVNEIFPNNYPIDVTEFIVAPPILSTEEEGTLYESVMLLLDDYMNENILSMSNPKFHTIIFNELYQFLLNQFEDINSEDLEDTLLDIVYNTLTDYFMTIIPKRSFPTTFVRKHYISKNNMSKMYAVKY